MVSKVPVDMCMIATMLTLALQSGKELFECLVKHGCPDFSAFVDSTRQRWDVVTSGGFGDVRRAVLNNGTFVAVKTLRLHVLLGDDDKAMKVNLGFCFRSTLF